MVTLGNILLQSPVLLAPMAGVTDACFRLLCRRYGAGLTTTEMLTTKTELWDTPKSRLRLKEFDDSGVRSIQIAGSEPEQMAEAARGVVAHGAELVDINMGCPAKKVCKKAAGSALLKDEVLVADILQAVVAAVDVPVTLKMRTGWSTEHRNAVTIARIAEDAGIVGLAVHGRTRACGYGHSVEYDTIARVVEAVDIPVFANGDIDSAQKAAQVLENTGASGVMIGRAAFGRPWLFREITHFLQHNELPSELDNAEIHAVITEHLLMLHKFYGEFQGLRIARKHIGWYLDDLQIASSMKKHFNQLERASDQLDAVNGLFKRFTKRGAQAA